MRFAIEPQRDVTLPDTELDGWMNLLSKGETQFVKCSDDHAKLFALFGSLTGFTDSSELIGDFPSREAAQAAIEEMIIRDGLLITTLWRICNHLERG